MTAPRKHDPLEYDQALAATYMMCQACGKNQAISDFMPGSTTCKWCEISKENKQLAVIKSAQKGKNPDALGKTVKKMAEAIEAPHISQLCELMVNEFGGVIGFVKFWKAQIDMAATIKPGGTIVLNSCRAIMKLVETSTVNRHTAPDVHSLDDANLDDEFNKMVLKVLKVENNKPGNPDDGRRTA